ncbi:cytidine deaminase [Saprospira grandis]|uniref:cytidine deaminase n=1 Tax=Saprospira grandis TaxID=1008 RepID=UPI0022DE01A1|nr:cytidine deaminase [Saprospira grandis]WBM73555.1 cytidine deaminase [Saprospira grandis]
MGKKIEIRANYELFSKAEELPAIEAELLLRAHAACDTAYAPYSEFRVGAAALLENGEIVLGSNQENAAYPSTICAERAALFSAAAQFPGVAIRAVAIRVKTAGERVERPISPCGACRQVLFEFEWRQETPIQLLLQGDKGDIYRIASTKSLLPLLFDPSFL